ncbi:MAG: peptidoglycan DD-metalloendopeptidase family protein, partial [Alicyclobacillus sp.]|nr:peptidoglycan DD-metalloendopeptidase family protein [Alicyclobacillus sp.]
MKLKGPTIGGHLPQSSANTGSREPRMTRFRRLLHFDKSPDSSTYLSPTRFITAAVATASLFATAVTTGYQAMHRTQDWSRVYVKGTYVGLVPNRHDVIDAMQRIAVGYHVNVSFAPVHTTVPPEYNWQLVASLPTQAAAIRLNGQPLLYTASIAAARRVLSTVRNALLPDHLQRNATIAFVGQVTVRPAVVGIAKVLSPDTAVRRILHPSSNVMVGRSADLHAILRPVVTDGPAFVKRVTLPAESAPMQSASGTPQASATAPTATGHSKRQAPLLQISAQETVHKTVTIQPPVRYVDNAKLPTSVRKVLKSGKPGIEKQTVRIDFLNGQMTKQAIISKTIARKPSPEVVERGTNSGVAQGAWIWPTTYYDVTSGFGPRDLGGVEGFHPGIDIGCPTGTPVYATNDGVVETAGWNSGGYGNWVVINNGNGIETVFGHLSKVVACAGETVAKGQLIGYS